MMATTDPQYAVASGRATSEFLAVIDTSDIREGKLAEVKAAIGALAQFVELNEPRPIAYNVYLNENGTRMTVTQIHPDSESMEVHMEMAGSAFSKFRELLDLRTMDIYGTPSPRLLEQIRAKARMLGNPAVVVHELHGGFNRFAPVRS